MKSAIAPSGGAKRDYPVAKPLAGAAIPMGGNWEFCRNMREEQNANKSFTFARHELVSRP